VNAVDDDFLPTTSFFMRGIPARLSGKAQPHPPELRLFADPSSAGLPGLLVLGRIPRTIAVDAK